MTETIEVDGAECVVIPKEEFERIHERIDEQNKRIEELDEENKDLRAEVNDLKQHNGREHAQINRRISEVEEDLESIEETGSPDENPGFEAGEEETQDGETPLERICTLPENVVSKELTANQQRARFIAKDITGYGQSVPAGIRIDTTTIRKVLSAAADDGEKIYRTTIKRTMEFLNEFGGDDVEVMKRNGRRIAVFSTELVDRLKRTDVCYSDQEGGPLLTG